MRKVLAALVLSGMIAGVSGPAQAGRTKTIKKEVTFTAPVPAPVYSDVDPAGCLWQGAVEDVSKDTYQFKTPKHRGKGTLNFKIDGFDGDWDLYVFDEKGGLLASSTTNNEGQSYEAVTVRLAKLTTVDIVTCNWQSTSQTADGHLLYKYKK